MELSYIDLFDRAARIAAGRDALVDETGALAYAEVSARTRSGRSSFAARR